MGEDGPLVLLTGAEGEIGSGFREEYLARYSDSYRLRLGVGDPGFRDDRFSDVVFFRLEDLDGVRKACRGVDTIVHLAANAHWQARFEELLEPNVVGAYHVFEAAREAGCRRVIYASSVHAIMGYPVDRQAHEDDPAWPDSVYGASKVFGEALCGVYSYLHGLSCLAIRIGAYVPDEKREKIAAASNPQFLDIAVTQRDLCHLIHRCVLAPEELRHAVLHGVSDNRFKRMGIERTRALVDYEPRDDAFDLSDVVGLGPEEKV